MTHRMYSLREIAPPVPATTAPVGEKVWLLNLDQIEPHTGALLSTEHVQRSGLGTSTHAFDDGNVLYSKLRPYLNKVLIPETAGYCTSELVPMRPNQELVTREYLAAYLRSPYFLDWVSQQVDGAKMPRVSMKILWEHKVELPSLEEQKRIAAVLEKADGLRRKRQKASRLAVELVRSKFVEMFGEPLTNARGLPTTTLGELAKLKSGEFLPSHEMAGRGGVLVYGGNGVNGEHDKVMFDETKLVIGRVGAYCGAVHLTKPRNWITDNALYVSEISPKVRLEYLAFALTQAKLNQYSSQSGQPLVSASRLYAVRLVLPTLSLQDNFLDVLKRAQLIQASQANSLLAIEEMSRSLAVNFFMQG